MNLLGSVVLSDVFEFGLTWLSAVETTELVWFEMVEVFEFISKLNACGFTAR